MKFRDLITVVGTVISILTGVIALVIFGIKGIEVEKRQIKVQSIAIEELTSSPKVDKFSVYYTYDSLRVERLWRLVLTSRNTGNKSIIGEGYHSNLLNNVFKITF